jgi:uncharacterized protein
MEQSCRYPSDGHTLEALFQKKHPERVAIVTHPHPLYGGSMHNPVVECLCKAYQAKGYSTLRFNFRGTGHSSGQHDDGRGEIDDILATYAFLINQGFSEIDLAGYSFGAWVGLMAAAKASVFQRLTLVSPPVDFIPFGEIPHVSALGLIIAGSNDEYGSPDHIKKLLKNWNKNAILVEIANADHFYSGTLDSLEKVLDEQL